MSNTSILEGIKAQSSKYMPTKQFIIKSKPSAKQNKQTIDSQVNDPITATSRDVQLFFNYMIQKSKRFEQLLAQNAILNQEEFCRKHLYSSTCIKTILKSVLDKMLSDKRLGKNLKGMNKSNMEEIQGHIWSSLQRQVSIYLNQRKYVRERDQLKNDLQQRKREIMKQLKNVSLKYELVQRQLCLNQDDNGSNQQENDTAECQVLNQQSAEIIESKYGEKTFQRGGVKSYTSILNQN